MSEIGKHLNVDYSTVSRRLKRMEKKNTLLQDLTLYFIQIVARSALTI